MVKAFVRAQKYINMEEKIGQFKLFFEPKQDGRIVKADVPKWKDEQDKLGLQNGLVVTLQKKPSILNPFIGYE